MSQGLGLRMAWLRLEGRNFRGSRIYARGLESHQWQSAEQVRAGGRATAELGCFDGGVAMWW